MHLKGADPHKPFIFPDIPPDQILFQFATLCAVATFLCGPGAAVLAFLVFGYLKRFQLRNRVEPARLIWRGMGVGMAVSILNLPGFLAGLVLHSFSLTFLLFAVAGANCGAWIAWQAYRATEPAARFFPRFTLATLLALVFGWGVILALFMPQRV